VPSANTSISTELDRAFERKGIETHTDASVVALQRDGDRIRVQHSSGSSAAETIVEVVFLAVGWPGNVHQLALDAAGITAQRHTIPVDAQLRRGRPPLCRR
jgi:pyruvate/2-oxoglutarate dehydrogenase complex dihydrolipoamide dehydrogenase (E3) component